MTTKNILKIGTLTLAFFSAIPMLAKSGKGFFRAKQKNVESYKSRRKSPNHLRVPGRALPIKNGQILAKGQSENSSGQAVRKPFRDANGYCVVSINTPESIKLKSHLRQPVESVEGSYVEMNHSSVSLGNTLLCNGDYLVEHSYGAMISLVGENSENIGYTILKTKNKDVIWLLKSHPAEKWYGGLTLEQTIKGKLPSNIILLPDDYSGKAVMDVSDALVTIHGTSAIEYAAHGKPVLVADKGWFQDCNFVL